MVFTQSKWLEKSLFPYAVILQVTPVVSIAPLIIIWVGDINLSLLICAWIVAFFPILSNTILGLNSADHNLINLFQLYRANRWQTLRYLRLPAALPYFLGGLKISGGLALIGAVVAEFFAGTGGSASGLAYRILQAGFRLKIPRMFAALIMISLTGIAIFLLTSWIAHLALRRWHESAVRRENSGASFRAPCSGEPVFDNSSTLSTHFCWWLFIPGSCFRSAGMTAYFSSIRLTCAATTCEPSG